MIRRKIEKYLLRAEKIYNLHLSLESKVIQSYVSKTVQGFVFWNIINLKSEIHLFSFFRNNLTLTKR